VAASDAENALRVAAVTGALAIVTLLTCVPPGNNDLWLQITIGGMIWNSGEIPATLLFPFTEVKDFAFHSHEWLSSVAFFLLNEALGHDRLQVASWLFGMATFGLAWRLAFRLTASFPLSLFLALLAMTAANYRYALRPEIFACLFVLIELNLLTEYRLSGRRTWLAGLVPLALLWANCHGSFPIGLVIASLFAAGEAISARRVAAGVPYGIALAGMAAATLLNPKGVELFYFAWDLRRWQVLQTYIIEWTGTFSAPFMAERGFWPYLFLLALCAAALVVYRRRATATEVLLLAVFGALSADRQRYVVFFALVAPFVLAQLAGPAALAGRRLTAALAALGAAGVGLLFVFGNLQGAYPYSTPSWSFSPPLVEYIEQERLGGNVINSYELGAELIHRFYPTLRPSIDSRIDSYGEPYFLHMLALLSDEREMLKFIDQYDVRYMLLLRRDFETVKPMQGLLRSGWRLKFADHKAVLLGR
jgi:hypothetical protein